jgi:hypothetical protein
MMDEKQWRVVVVLLLDNNKQAEFYLKSDLLELMDKAEEKANTLFKGKNPYIIELKAMFEN